MTNHPTLALSEAPAINRRKMLIGLAATSTAAGTVAIVSEAMPAEPQQTPRQRFHFHLAEMQRAAMEINPELRFNRVLMEFDDPRFDMPIMICAMKATGWYQGDGVYVGGSHMNDRRYRVELLDERIDGERGFLLTPVGRRDINMNKAPFTLSETKLEAFIGERLS